MRDMASFTRARWRGDRIRVGNLGKIGMQERFVLWDLPSALEKLLSIPVMDSPLRLPAPDSEA